MLTTWTGCRNRWTLRTDFSRSARAGTNGDSGEFEQLRLLRAIGRSAMQHVATELQHRTWLSSGSCSRLGSQRFLVRFRLNGHPEGRGLSDGLPAIRDDCRGGLHNKSM